MSAPFPGSGEDGQAVVSWSATATSMREGAAGGVSGRRVIARCFLIWPFLSSFEGDGNAGLVGGASPCRLFMTLRKTSGGIAYDSCSVWAHAARTARRIDRDRIIVRSSPRHFGLRAPRSRADRADDFFRGLIVKLNGRRRDGYAAECMLASDRG